MNKNIKTTLIIIMGLLALTTVVGFIYGMQNRAEVNNIYASYDENILTAVDRAVNVCRGVFEEAKVSDEEMENINDYAANIENAESPVLKGYIADSMLTYAGDFMTVRSQNYANGEDIPKANFTGIQERLASARTSLDAAREYKNDTATTQIQN